MGASISACIHPTSESHRPALVLWDIENVRAPLAASSSMTMGDALRHIRQRLVYDAGFTEHRAVCCVTPGSLKAMHAQSSKWLEAAVPEMTVMLAAQFHPKRGADVVLKQELSRFTREHWARARHTRIVLLTGDEDFLEPAQHALAQGFDVQLVYYGPSASEALLRLPFRSPPIEWRAFLASCNNGVVPELSYGASKSVPRRCKQTQTDRWECEIDRPRVDGVSPGSWRPAGRRKITM